MSDATLEAADVKPKLQVANGYSVNFDQLAQLLHAIHQDGRSKVPVADLANRIGLALRQMEYLTSIAVALGLVAPIKMSLTPLGSLVLEKDHFFDDLGTLWFLHYVVGSNPQLLVWNRFINEFMPGRQQFAADDLRRSYDDLRFIYSANSARQHVNKEVNTILDAYTRQNFSKLAYIKVMDGGFGLGYRQAVPLLVIAASIARFRDRHQPTHTAISVRDLLIAPNSPGVVFQMSEDALRAAIEQLRTGHGFSLETRGDLDQLRFAEETTDIARMERYYASR